MSWGAVGIAHFADDMSIYCANIQRWIEQAQNEMSSIGLSKEFFDILGVVDLFGADILFGVTVSSPVDDINKQLDVLDFAIKAGVHFEDEDGKDANSLIERMLERRLEFEPVREH